MQVEIGRSDASLRLHRVAHGSPPVAHAEVRIGDELVGRSVVQPHYASAFDDLADYFCALAAEWRGWRGDRTWQSLEGELSLSATHDGHVRLQVKLRGPLDHGWRLACQVTIDAGEQLSAAARDVTDFASEYSN